MAGDDSLSWVIDRCLESDDTDPVALLEDLMADERCAVFGVVHHVLVGAVFLTCMANVRRGVPSVAEGDVPSDRNRGTIGDDNLHEQLLGFSARSVNVPGGSCARWGVCGAAASAGMAYAIAKDNDPLRREGWSEGQRLVADILARISETGAPRCCKRDARIAVEVGKKHFEKLLLSDGDKGFDIRSSRPVCSVSARNTVCLGCSCPYNPQHCKRAHEQGGVS